MSKRLARSRLILIATLLIAGVVSAGEDRSEDADPLRARYRQLEAAESLMDRGLHREAVSALKDLLARDRERCGDVHDDVADTLARLGDCHTALEEWAAARSAWLEARELRESLHGPEDWRVLDARLALEDLDRIAGFTPAQLEKLREATHLERDLNERYQAGEYAEGSATVHRILEIERELFGGECVRVARTLANLAELQSRLGSWHSAVETLRGVLAIHESVLGRAHPDYAYALGRLAGLHRRMGDLDRSEAHARRSLEVLESALGDGHPDLAIPLGRLAAVLLSKGEIAEAEGLYLAALAIEGQVYGEGHPRYARTLNNLAILYAASEQPQKAESMLRRSMEIRRREYGAEHPRFARSLHNLACILYESGKYEDAESLHTEALRVRTKILGDDHPDVASSLVNLALAQAASGNAAAAESSVECGMKIRRHFLDLTSVIQSERQQLLMAEKFRFTLDVQISLTHSPGVAHDAVLVWKGAIQARLAQVRAGAEDATLLEEFGRVSRRLASLATSSPEAEKRAEWRAEIDRLAARREDLEVELSRANDDFRTARASVRLDSATLSELLPEGTALVDFLNYVHIGWREVEGRRIPDLERRFVGFIVRPGSETTRVEFGPASRIDAAVQAWRRSKDDSKELDRLVWAPISAHVAGAETLLVSPDGSLCRFPFAALAGREPGSWLIEDMAISVLPVPQLMPVLLARPRPAEAEFEESLLLLGDLDYGEQAPEVDRAPFVPLPETRAEVLAIRDSFEQRYPDGQVKVLRAGRATEQAFCSVAPGFRWIHLATHGFFGSPGAGTDTPGSSGAPEAVELNPGLLSGLALSGANRGESAAGGDGLLTALEVGALDLSGVEMVVLSACDTGLGTITEGEGVLGLQRTFQVAGARTTVTSLWSVDDEATRALMTRFYDNLWDRGMTRGEALREAQLHLMHGGDPRGLQVGEGHDRGREHPDRWAGFVLSGDWR